MTTVLQKHSQDFRKILFWTPKAPQMRSVPQESQALTLTRFTRTCSGQGYLPSNLKKGTA